jgi:chaperone required for assembly of F1-ATPase
MAAARDEGPIDVARRHAAPGRLRRFYERAEMVAEAGGFALRLDGKPAITPGRQALVVRLPQLARAIAAEWAEQGEWIDVSAMPATRLANTAIDGVAHRQDEVRSDILAYAGSDLLYYRAAEPEGLVARQRQAWDPVLGWAERYFGARFALAEGVMHVAQPEPTLAAIGAELATFDDPFRLAALSLATALTGSALIALALAAGAIEADAAWTAAHVDEDWNISQWGADREAMRRRAYREADFRSAALTLGPPPQS